MKGSGLANGAQPLPALVGDGASVAGEPLTGGSWRVHLPTVRERCQALASALRFLPLRDSDGARGAVYCDTPRGRALVDRLRQAYPQKAGNLFLVPQATFQAVYARIFATELTRFAQTHLARTQPLMSARQTLERRQAIAFAAIAGVLVLWGLLSAPSLFVLLNAVFAFFYLSVGMARLVAVLTPLPRVVRYRPQADRMTDAALPPYSVLVPIYHEAAMVPQLIAALRALDYPADKLDILILAEADDHATLKALAAEHLPGHIAVLELPPSLPRTKPKALNFALPLTRGTYVTIFDAEDRPEPDQLRKAVASFMRTPVKHGRRVACVQAALTITNGRSSFFSSHFALEYMALFDAFLPALARFHLPIPLGGTSNHFLRSVLIEAGGWDPYNVTEDADLGIRLARLGYATQIIDSTTFEEAPSRFTPWIKQRARWFKGWWQTWLVHMRQPLRLMHELGLPGFIAFQTIMLGVLVSVLIHPFFLVATLWAISGLGGSLFAEAGAGGQALITINLANFVLGYLAAVALSGVGAERRGMKGVVPVLISIPVYWVFLSVAGFLALWELIRRPHHWNKTPHGAG